MTDTDTRPQPGENPDDAPPPTHPYPVVTDIVERLRFCGTELDGHYGQASIFGEAADAIEDLQNDKASLLLEIDSLHAEIEKLRHRCRELDASLTDALEHSRNEALEEAAKVADGKAGKAGDFAPQIGRAAKEIAAAIRALEEAAQTIEAQPIRHADRVSAAAAIRALKETRE